MGKEFKKEEISENLDSKEFKKENKSNKKSSQKKGKGKDKDKKDPDFKKDKFRVNDASLYYEDANLLGQVTSYSFEQFLGRFTELSEQVGDSCKFGPGNIMTVWLNPSVQTTDENRDTDGINIAAVRNFLYQSASNMKNTNYVAADPMLLMNAIRSGIEYYTWIRRSFGLAYTFNLRNRDYPTTLLEQNLIDADDFRANLAEYLVRFNTLVALFDRVPFPTNVPILDKAAKIYDMIYLDEDSPMAQTFMFAPFSIWKIKEDYSPTGVGLETVKINTGATKTMKFYLDIFEDIIGALANSSLLNYIYADILKAQADKGIDLVKLETIPFGYTTSVGVSPEIRIWLHNCIVVGEPLDMDQMPVGWTTGRTGGNDMETNVSATGINYHPMFKLSNVANEIHSTQCLQNGVVDFETLNPSIEARVAATRLAARFKPKRCDDAGFEGVYSGDYPVLGDYYIVAMRLTTAVGTTQVNTFYGNVDGMTTTNLLSTIRRLCWVDQFNFAPITYIGRGLPDNDGNYLHAVHGDLNYYTTLDYDYMKAMRDAEMLGEFTYRMATGGKQQRNSK